MEKEVYNGQKFTEESKNNVRNSIKKRNRLLLPNFLTIAAACSFFGLGTFYIATETGLFQADPTHTSNENKVSVVESPLDLNGDLPPNQPLMINDELINSLSLPLEIQSAVPSVSSKPIISAKTISEGYSVSLTFPGDGFEVNMIENVVPFESIEKYKETRTPIWSDEKNIKINGYDAFYSDDQKELHVFMPEKYFILHGAAEEDQMLVLALMIDHNKPVQGIELKKYEDVIMDSVEPAEIKQKVYLSSDFHKQVTYLKSSEEALMTAEKNETAFTIRLHYSAPIDSSELMVEQHYNANGHENKIDQIRQSYSLVKEMEMDDRKLLLYSNEFWHLGYFTYENNLFEVRTMNSVSLEHVEEILNSIQLK